MAADLAAGQLIAFMNSNKVPYAVRLSAARDLLDRAGLSATHRLDVTAKWTEDIDAVMSLMDDIVDGEIVEESEEDGPAVQSDALRELEPATPEDDELLSRPRTVNGRAGRPPKRRHRSRLDRLAGEDDG